MGNNVKHNRGLGSVDVLDEGVDVYHRSLLLPLKWSAAPLVTLLLCWGTAAARAGGDPIDARLKPEKLKDALQTVRLGDALADVPEAKAMDSDTVEPAKPSKSRIVVRDPGRVRAASAEQRFLKTRRVVSSQM